MHRFDSGDLEIVAGSVIIATALFLFALAAEAPYVIFLCAALAVIQVRLVLRYREARRLAQDSAPRPPAVEHGSAAHAPLHGTPAADVPLALRTPEPAGGQWPAGILDFTHDAIILWEMDGGGIVYWNRAAEQLYGFTREQAHRKVTHDLLKTRSSEGVQELEAKLARYGVWIGELRHTRSDGRLVEVEARLSLMRQEEGRPWLVLEVNRDVTDRNRAEAARRETEWQLERMRGQSYAAAVLTHG